MAEATKKGKAPKMTPEQRAQEKRTRFLTLAPKRTSNALKQLANVERCFNKATYTFTKEEAGKIVKALWDSVDSVARAADKADDAKKTDLFAL